ncbi:alpha/beta fold hydrolase [Actinoplanes sp. NPDC051851]|uniref:alpha/beta fold hydrolase n=1 Tax=Actinoplanes sp. NPDC051851 TaxID=3154753 RepID=UPI0034142C05
MAPGLRPGRMSPAYAELPALRLAYRAWGPPDGRPVLWLPGASSDGTTFEQVAALLPVRSYALDPRGYFASDRAAAYGPETTRDDVIAFLDALGIDRAVLAGHSAGGVAAWRTALAHPDRIEAVILEETPPPVPHALHPRRPEGDPGYDWAARLATLAVVNDPPEAWWDDLSRIAVPALVLAGGPESHLDQDAIRRMAAAIPGSSFVSVGGGHACHRARPAPFAAAVRDFLHV